VGQLVRFDGPRGPKPDPKHIADKLQVLLLLWPEAGREVEQLLDELLSKIDTS